MEQGIAVFSKDGRLVICSSAFVRLFDLPGRLRQAGTPVEDILRHNAQRGFLGEGDACALQDAALKAMKTSSYRRRDIRTCDGRTLAIAHSVEQDGRIIVTASDVTERREVERLKDEFVSSVSHELRTPLTSITGSLGLLLGGAAGELSTKAARLVDIAHQNAQRLTKLVNELLDIDKIEAGQVEMKHERVDLNELVLQEAEHNRPYAERFRVRLQTETVVSPVLVLGDPDRLRQVVTNLVSNAVKYSPAGGTVTLAVERLGEMARIAVSDNGPGIPAEFQSRIFQRFAQADSSDRRAQEGTGLGLAISRAIVDRHGGRIGFNTEPGVGTTFYVDLREVSETAARRQPMEFRILICEEDGQLGVDMAEILTREGASVDLVSTVRDASDRLGAQSYQVLITDLMLPDGNGIDLIQDVRRRPELRDLAVLVVSGAAREARQALQAGALNVLDWLDKKSLNGSRLVTSVARAAALSTSGRLRVLHVEDEADLREIVAVALTDFADVDFAETVAAARERLAECRYDVVILDLMLPDGSGAQLLPVISDCSAPPPPVIIFSASEPTQEVVSSVESALIKSQTTIQQLVDIVRRTANSAQRTKTEAAM